MKYVSNLLIWLSQKLFDVCLWLDDLAGKVDPENTLSNQVQESNLVYCSRGGWPIIYPNLYTDVKATELPNSTSEGIAKYRPETFKKFDNG